MSKADDERGRLIGETFKMIGGKWKILILWNLSLAEKQRFGELKKRMPGISQRVLTLQLRDLESHGLITREVFPEVPPRVEYGLTKKANGLSEIFAAVCAWKRKYARQK